MLAFGEILKQKREMRGWSQPYLAQRLGIHRASIYNYEGGLSVPTLYVLVELANLFECSLDELVGREFNKTNTAPDSLVIDGTKYVKSLT